MGNLWSDERNGPFGINAEIRTRFQLNNNTNRNEFLHFAKNPGQETLTRNVQRTVRLSVILNLKEKYIFFIIIL